MKGYASFGGTLKFKVKRPNVWYRRLWRWLRRGL